jgi:ribosome-binding factor A
MHPFKRSARVGDLIRKETADIIMHKLRDPRIGFVTVTGAKVGDDLRHATVYISVFEDKKLDLTMKVLKSSVSFVRTELSRRLKMRFIPEIHFEIDEAVMYGRKIDSILDDIKDDLELDVPGEEDEGSR